MPIGVIYIKATNITFIILDLTAIFVFFLPFLYEEALLTLLAWLLNSSGSLVTIYQDAHRYLHLKCKKMPKCSNFFMDYHFCKNIYLPVTQRISLIFFPI